MDLKQALARLGQNLTAGWASLIESAGLALTRFRPTSEETALTVESRPARWGLLSTDLYEEGDDLVLNMEIPGLEPDDLQLEVQGDQLVVSGKKEYQQQRSEGPWHISECAYGAFERRIPLPAAVKAEQAKASYRRGILNLHLPLENPGKKPRTIKVKTP